MMQDVMNKSEQFAKIQAMIADGSWKPDSEDLPVSLPFGRLVHDYLDLPGKFVARIDSGRASDVKFSEHLANPHNSGERTLYFNTAMPRLKAASWTKEILAAY